MAATKVNLDNMAYGVPEDETGIQIDNFEQAFRFRKKEEVLNRTGGTRGVVYVDPRAEISLDGEVDGTTGIMTAALGAAITLANLLDGHGITAGNVYVDEVTRTLNRDALSRIAMSATRYPLITGA